MGAVLVAFWRGQRFDNPVMLVLFTVACCGVMIAGVGVEVVRAQEQMRRTLDRAFTAVTDFLTLERGERLDQQLPAKNKRPAPTEQPGAGLKTIRHARSDRPDSAASR